MLFCRVTSWLTGRRLVSLPFSDHCEPLVNDISEFRELLAAPTSELKNKHWKYVEVRPKTATFVAGSEEYPERYLLHALDLRPNLESIFKGLHADSIRRKIRRAERERLVLETGNNERLLADFYRLHLTTRRRHRLPPHPKRWFRNLLESFQSAAVVRVAKREGTAIAAVLTIESARTLVYKYGCSEARFHNTGAMPFVFWDMIRDAKLRGFSAIDLGRTEIDNEGLAIFKERWGATREQLVYARFPPRRFAVSPSEKRIIYLAKLAFARCPDSILAAAGRVLYPHVG
jgi:lipid II:glycine glycyltransferase (peptidoglycan interpeptide bridge formation enzyme)